MNYDASNDAVSFVALVWAVWFGILLAWLVKKSRIVSDFVSWFRQKSTPVRILVVCAFTALSIFAGTKSGGNAPLSMPLPTIRTIQTIQTIQTITPSLDLVSVRTNGVAFIAASSNAVEVAAWRQIGGTEMGAWIEGPTNAPVFAIGTNPVFRCYASASGSVSFESIRRPPIGSALPDLWMPPSGRGEAAEPPGGVRAYPCLCPMRTPLGFVPEARWPLVFGPDAPGSRFWHDRPPGGGLVLTWENALVDRLPGRPVSIQVELRPSGDCTFRYNFPDELDPPPTNFVMGAQMGTNGVNALSILGTNLLAATVWHVEGEPVTNGVSVADLLCTNGVLRTPAMFELRWRNTTGLDPEADTDGDGLTDGNEVFLHDTDPRAPDSDFDGVADGTEVAEGWNPLVRDSDGDGLVDGSDPDPATPTALADLDGDSLPDAYETYWFGDTNAVDTADERDGTGFTLAAKLLGGINPTNAPSPPLVASTNSLVSWTLAPAFAADWPAAATNVVWERTFAIHRANAWQQFFVSSSPTNASAWRLEGMVLEWETDGGSAGTVAASPRGDSFRIPLPEDDLAASLTLRLRATAPSVRAPMPLHLLAYAPEANILGGQTVVGRSGQTFHVFLDGSLSSVGLALDHSLRPCRTTPLPSEYDLGDFAPTSSDFIGPDGGVLVLERPGIYTVPNPALVLATAVPLRSGGQSPGEGSIPIVVLAPSANWECQGHGCGYDGLSYDWATDTYNEEHLYPLDSACLRRQWYRDWNGGWLTGDCRLHVRSGLDAAASGPVSVFSDGASGSVLVDGVTVWTGSAPHSYGEGGCPDFYDEGFLSDKCGGCDADCASGNCDSLEGASLGSLRFRIPLGAPVRGHVAGFVWLDSDGPAVISRDAFRLLPHPSATISDTTAGGVRRIVCSDPRCRDLAIEDIAGGVRVTIRETASQSLEHTWEIANENGNTARIRLRKISRLDNVMSDETFVCVDGEWTRSDNIAGVSTQLETYGEMTWRYGGPQYETRTTRDPQGRVLAEITSAYSRIGECDNAVLRETFHSEATGRDHVWRAADYWDDPAHSARHGQPRIVWSNASAWTYTDFDENGRETLRVEQRGNADVPWDLPRMDAGGVSAIASRLSDAFVTVRDYTPLSGDSGHPDDEARPRTETRYVVRNGVATVVGRTWMRHTRLVRDSYDAVKSETWRAATQSAALDLSTFQPFNASTDIAYSYTIAYTETGTNTPLLLRGAVAESLDEDGILTVNAYSISGGVLTCASRRLCGVQAFPTYEVTERDAAHGTLLRRTTRLTDGAAAIADEQSLYDEKNRLRSTTYLDGTSITNAYSCCRLLWTRDRSGRTVLRSAQTGTDHLYHAMEDVWLADLSSNGAFRVTQHFFDALGRETNTVVGVANTPGEAATPAFQPFNLSTFNLTTYPYGGDDCAVRTDERGAVTRTLRNLVSGAVETVESVRTNGVEVQRTTTRSFLGGGSLLRREWDDVVATAPSPSHRWTEERRFDDYAANGMRFSYVVTTSSDCGAVTNSVSTYDLLGRLVSVSRPGANGSTLTTSYAYDGATSRKVSETTTGSPAIFYEYDALGELSATTQGEVSLRTATAYETIGGEACRVESRTRLTGSVTNSVQRRIQQLTGLSNALRSCVSSVAASGRETVEQTSFDPATGILTAVSQTENSTPVTEFSRFGLPLSRTSLDGRQEMAYDAFGRKIAVALSDTATGATNRVDFMEYDSSGNVVRRVSDFQDGRTAESLAVYDILNRESSRTDALGNVVTTCDALGRTVAVAGDAYPLSFGYDTAGRKTMSATTRDGGTTWDETGWEYDPASGVNTAKEFADGSRVAHAYTDNGRRTRTTYARGEWREHAYNDRNLVSGTTYSNADTPSVSCVYDDSGAQASASLSDGTAYAYARDDRLLVTNETVSVAQGECAIRRTYDAFRRPQNTAVAVTNIRHSATTRLYDAENRICGYALTNAAGRGLSVSFAHDGSYLTNTLYALPGGGTFAVSLTREPARKGLVTRRDHAFNGQPSYWYETGYDLLGRPTNATDSVSLAREWLYNRRSELVAANVGTNAHGYAYDTIGNRNWAAFNGATNTYAANSLNQYTSILRDSAPLRSFQYDSDGNLTRDDAFRYDFDAENRLVSATALSMTNGSVRVLNAYDHRHRRVTKTVQRLTTFIAPPPSLPVQRREWRTAETHTYVWDGDNIVLERIAFSNGTSRVCEYFWGPDMSGTEQGAGGVGGLLAESIDGVFYLPCYDHNGNIVRYVSESGAVAAEYVYDPYGGIAEEGGPLAAVFPFGFSTKPLDRETALVAYQCRFYKPAIGRWINRDPIEEEGGENLYAFCLNNPISYVDVNGEFFLVDTLISAAIGGVIGGVSAALTGGDVWAGVAGGIVSGACVSICPAAAAQCGAAGGFVSGFISGIRSANKAKLCGAKWHLHVAGSIVIGTTLGRYSGKLSSQLSDGLSQAAGMLAETTRKTGTFWLSLRVVGPDIATSISCGVSSTASETVLLTAPEAVLKAIDDLGDERDETIERIYMQFDASGQF